MIDKNIHKWVSNKKVTKRTTSHYEIVCSCGKVIQNYSTDGAEKEFFQHQKKADKP